MRYIAILLCALLLLPTTGCTVSQAKINTAIGDIKNWAPVIASDASALLTDIASFEPADAAQIQAAVTTINTDSAALTTACTQYLAAPSATLLTQIAAFVGTLATTDAQAIVSLAQIKNSTSQTLAKGILTTIATAVTILSGYLASVNVAQPAATSTALLQLRPNVNRAILRSELTRAQAQDLVPASLQPAELGF